MQERSCHLWRPIDRINKNSLWQDLDWAVQAQIRVQISAHLYSNMGELIDQGLSLDEFNSLSELVGLAPHLKTCYLLHILAQEMNHFDDLYALEERLWSQFKANEHDCILTQVLDLFTLQYVDEFSDLICRHYTAKNSVGNDFKNWFLHDGFKELVRTSYAKRRDVSLIVNDGSFIKKVTRFFSSFIQSLT